MACNENVIKNMANEITRNCQGQGVIVDSEFVIYLIDLLLLNPKYGKLFSKTINRNNLAYFVDECVAMLTRGEISISTLKTQFIIITNYDKLQNLINKHLDAIDSCLKPLVTEILEEDPESHDEAAFNKLFRKISIYIILASGLGNPGVIHTLKEGMAALESVFSIQDLHVFVALPRNEKLAQLEELFEIVSGVRLFNRDCKKGGDGIQDLPFNLVDAGKACLSALSNSLITVMQRVNTLTTAVADVVCVDEETGNVVIDIRSSDLTLANYKHMFDLLTFSRQYEAFVRRLLNDVETMLSSGQQYVERVRAVFEEIHTAVKYKSAVPVAAVFPLFRRVWQVWRSMQNVMYLISTVNRLMSILGGIQDKIKIPYDILNKMLREKVVVTDQERMTTMLTLEDRLLVGTLKNYVPRESVGSVGSRDKHIEYLGFCAMSLSVGALIPSNVRVGLIKAGNNRYGFCSVKMAARFSKDPDRYINEVLEYARSNPQVINLLNIIDKVQRVKDITTLVTKYSPKILTIDKDIQTETHPIDTYKEKNYHWDLWEWKRRACKWATIVNSQTHSTQTIYSHLRSEIQCQTVHPRDKCQQTKKDCGVNTAGNEVFLWGLRGQLGYGQHNMDLGDKHSPDKKRERTISVCQWPCIENEKIESPKSQKSPDDDDLISKSVEFEFSGYF